MSEGLPTRTENRRAPATATRASGVAKADRSGRGGRLRAVAGSLAGAAIAAAFVAAVEAHWVKASTPNLPPYATLLSPSLGLVAPVGALLGLVTSVVVAILHGGELPSYLRWRSAVRLGPAPARAHRAAALLLAPLGAVAALVGMGRLTLLVFADANPAVATGPAVGFGAGLCLAVTAVFVLAGSGALAPLLARHRVDPAAAALVGLGLGTTLLALGVSTGDVGGVGGPLALFGVLRREELDLRLPVACLAMCLAAYLAPAGLRRLPRWLTFAIGVAPLAATGLVAVGGFPSRAAALGFERSAPMGRLALGTLRRASDRDGDGAAAAFGGGDCDDADPSRYPGAYDVPGNGSDEDCSGSDAEQVAALPAPAKPPPTTQEWIERHLPRDLNVVVLTIDALRWDAVGFMGYPLKTTPNLDRLAAEGVVFERAYALASYTGKSLPPTMLGKHTSETHRGWAHFNRIDERETLVWERLQRHGVKTLSVQGYWYFFRKGIGFERGWDVLDGSPAPSMGYTDEDKSRTSDKIADRTIAVLGDPELQRRPFFFWTHYVDPHADYVPHEGFDFGRSQRALYDGELAFTDHHVGRVIDFIRRGPLGPRTAIIISADHGEAFGEHGMVRHGFEIWEPLVRVPLVVFLPGVAPRRISQARSLVDLAPTLLELFRAPSPTGIGDDFLSGRSLVADILAPPGHTPEARPVFIDMAAGPNNADRQALIDGGKKLIASNGRPLGLYDLATDPAEALDLLEDASQREAMVARFQAFRRQLRAVIVAPPR